MVTDVQGSSGVLWKCKQGVLSVSVVRNAGSTLNLLCSHFHFCVLNRSIAESEL